MGVTRYEISVTDRERREVGDIESRFRIIEQVAKLVEEFNDHWDARRYSEALTVAMKAREIRPTEPAVIMMMEKARLAIAVERNAQLATGHESANRNDFVGPQQRQPVQERAGGGNPLPADAREPTPSNPPRSFDDAAIPKLTLGPGESAEFTMPILGRQMISLPASVKSVSDADPGVVEVRRTKANEVRLVGVGLGESRFEIVLADDSTAKVNLRVTAEGAPGTKSVDFRFDSRSVPRSLVILDSLPKDRILGVRVSGTKKLSRNTMVIETSGDPPVAVTRTVPETVSINMSLPIESRTGLTAQTPKGLATHYRIPEKLTVQNVRVLYRSEPWEADPPPEILGLGNADESQFEWAVDVAPVPPLNAKRPSISEN